MDGSSELTAAFAALAAAEAAVELVAAEFVAPVVPAAPQDAVPLSAPEPPAVFESEALAVSADDPRPALPEDCPDEFPAAAGTAEAGLAGTPSICACMRADNCSEIRCRESETARCASCAAAGELAASDCVTFEWTGD
jgi:hypothetical protein